MNILKVLTKRRVIGNIGEDAAKSYLKKRGYKILERNYVSDGNEIDIIARTKDTLAFIEVKTRSIDAPSPYESRPAASVDSEKQRKIINAARYYLAYFGRGYRARFDIIEVNLDSNKKVVKINHLENAFNKNTAYTGRYKK